MFVAWLGHLGEIFHKVTRMIRCGQLLQCKTPLELRFPITVDSHLVEPNPVHLEPLCHSTITARTLRKALLRQGSTERSIPKLIATWYLLVWHDLLNQFFILGEAELTVAVLQAINASLVGTLI